MALFLRLYSWDQKYGRDRSVSLQYPAWLVTMNFLTFSDILVHLHCKHFN